MDYYDIIAEGYEELHKEEQLNKLRIIKNNVQISNKAKLLDVGCGTGISSNFDCDVIGIDPSVQLTARNRNPKKIIGVAENLPFKNSSFDYVVSITSLHNFKNIKKSIDEIKRVGKDNFIFSVLRKSNKYSLIRELIRKNFKVYKTLEEDKDTIFFCKTISFIYRK